MLWATVRGCATQGLTQAGSTPHTNILHTARLEALSSLNFLDARAVYTASDDCLRTIAHYREIQLVGDLLRVSVIHTVLPGASADCLLLPCLD